MKRQKSALKSKPDKRICDEHTSSSSTNDDVEKHTRTISQEHARPGAKPLKSSSLMFSHISTSDMSTAISNTSLGSSISRFRDDFEELKCKMKIFGESLNLCRCIAGDFKNKLTYMEQRLESLERRQNLWRSESNYSAIIQKNKRLSHKTLQEAKKLQMCGTEEEMREVAAKICRNYLHGAWKTIEPSELEFSRISGGLSNFLYYVALPEGAGAGAVAGAGAGAGALGGYLRRESSPDAPPNKLASKSVLRSNSFTVEEPKKVLLRIYGQVHGERAMDAIVTESVIFTLLSERRLGPKLHGVFSGGRIEEYIPARPLLTKELADPSLSMKIAEKMAAIHSMDVPLNKEPNWLWKTMAKWLKTVRDEMLAGNSQGKNEEEQHIVKQLKAVDLEKEIEWLKKFLATVESPVVFCHNDMQEGNILILEDTVQSTEDEVLSVYVQTYDADSPKSNKENNHTKAFTSPLSSFEDANTSDSVSSRISDSGEPKLVLIDFEYCAYNYRGFDIANHFQEWGYDYTNPEHPFYFENQENCPTLEQKEIFIKEYLKHYHMNLNDGKEKWEAPSIDDVNHLLAEVDAFALASHLFWCLWSLVNASKSQIPFGYWEYALSRLETYLRLKQEVIKDKHGFPQKRKICEVDI